ncbi:MAG: hypothetical protein JOZ96_16160 [Acidobacteria bacterium]|nr:hypothetical protein [Acidobacteriota bacterium]
MKWTRRFRKARAREDGPRERAEWGALLALVLVMAALVFVYAYPRLTRPPLAQRDFEGRVVEKFVALGESQIGSRTFPRLGVETANGARFNVAVTDEMYQRARVGMRVSRHRGELILSGDVPELSAPGGGPKVEAR